ncbi:hypothetical protein GOP47_0006688 [Adiantum capillus-veneris]|uniref:F-box domain-containing protein n=1 Tax=Adiantum capillus-veneris TaxID=13818 RepID=A0A9D4V4W9_ADICA|nr:hypothetical protein GOP47_0006688 [Adiantum capillus-veneris]
MESEERRGLIPRLPEELVLVHVVPRLPWYARPVCRSISKHWRASLDSLKMQPDLAAETRKYQLPLLKDLFLIRTDENAQLFIAREHTDHDKQRETYTVFGHGSHIYEIEKRQWRKLPPLQGLLRGFPKNLLGQYGMVYVWSDCLPRVVLKMDLGCGDWTWRKLRVPHCLNVNTIFNGKIYVPRFYIGGLTSDRTIKRKKRKEVILIYDMMADQYEEMEVGNAYKLRMILKRSSESGSQVKEELYRFLEYKSKLELLVFDGCMDSWKVESEIPYPEWRWTEMSNVHLLNGDCFEPALETDVNIVWWTNVDYFMLWFNPSLHKTWVCVYCEHFQRMHEIFFIRGSLYAVFQVDVEDQDDDEYVNEDSQEEEKEEEFFGSQKDATLCESTVMNQRICKDEENQCDKTVDRQEGEEIRRQKDIALCKNTIMTPRICKDQEAQYDEEEGEKATPEEEVVVSHRDAMFFKRTIVRGKICVAEGIVKWEKVRDVGIFEENSFVPLVTIL